MTTTTFTLQVQFTSDWHVGDGAGRHGLIDRIVRRHPEDGLPFVPAKTLTGIWRDACERVALGLDDGTPGRWSAWVEALFGDEPARREEQGRDPAAAPRRGLLAVRPARLPETMRAVLQNAPALKRALTFVKPGVSIDPNTGQAKTDFLRFEEMVRTGACLIAPVTLITDAEPDDAALALLWAGARTVERLGGKRRRGTGLCIWTLHRAGDEPPITGETALATLAATPPMPPPALTPASGGFRYATLAATDTRHGAWRAVTLHLGPVTPLVIPRAVVGNVVESHAFVPGTHLLGAITARLRALGVDPFPWVAAGRLRISHAYPEVAGARGLPVPMVLAYDKARGGLEKRDGRVANRLLESAPPDGQFKQYRGGFVGPDGDDHRPTFEHTDLMVTTHSTIEDEAQRPTEAVGGVYSYQAIHPHTRLRAELWLAPEVAAALDEAAADWWRHLDGECTFGRARKDDYGLAALTAGAPAEAPIGEAAPVATITVWLLSDLLLRDDALEPATSLDALRDALTAALPAGTELAHARAADGLMNGLLRPSRSDGWHQGWGLPRPSYVGIAAGSCAVFSVTAGQVTTADLRRIEHQGLGERRAEGFGEVLLNPTLLAREFLNLPPAGGQRQGGPAAAPAEQQPGGTPTQQPEDPFLTHLRCVALREHIRERALIRGAAADFRRDILHWRRDNPGNSQLGNLRRVLARLRGASDQTNIDHLPGPATAQLHEQNRQAANRVLTWTRHVEPTGRWPDGALAAIREVLGEPNRLWTEDWLGLSQVQDSDSPLSGLADAERAALLDRFWPEAVRTMFAAAMHAEIRSREGQSAAPREERP